MIAVVILLTSCSTIVPKEHTYPRYNSYKEIPGVTAEDIAAIDNLLIRNSKLVYGFPLSTEAFYSYDGCLSGFIVSLYNRMSELFGFEFIPYICTWDELLEKIESNEIDFTAEFTPTQERLEKYYMTYPIVQRSIKIFTNTNNEDLYTISKNRAVRCAFITGSTIYSIVENSWDIPFEPVFIDAESEVAGYFLNDSIDAYIDECVMGALFDDYNSITSSEYFPLYFSPVSLTTNNPELAPIIYIMEKYLENGGLSELAEIYTKGDKDYLQHKLFMDLTDKEKVYINSHNTEDTAILIACEADNYPSSFYDYKEKEFQGIANEVLDNISELTTLKFITGNTVKTAWEDISNSLENGEYALVTELLQTNNRKNRFLWSEESFSSSNYALLSRADYPNVDINQVLFKKIGLLKDSAFEDVFFEWFPDSVNTVFYSTTEESFAALEKGEIDLLMASQSLLLYITNYLEKPYFKTNIVFNYSAGSYFGFNKDEEILRSIVNKAQRYVDTESISETWKRKIFDYNNKLLKDIFPFAITFSSMLIAALFVVVLLFLKNKKFSKNLENIVAKRTNELEVQTSTLTAIFEAIPDLVFCKDLNFNFTQYNRSFKNHFNFRENMIGKSDQYLHEMPADMVDFYRSVDEQVIREKCAVTVEETIAAADGSSPLFETIKTPLMQNGKLIGIMGISRNITLRKAAEETLKLTLDNLNTCIYITEIETGKILFINEKMAKEFGKSEYYGKVCWEVLQDGFTERCEFCPVPKLLKSGDEYHVWEEHNTVTGRHYENTDSIVKWHDGRLVHMQHSVDITEAAKLKQELEHASRAKGDFLSRMSHEIRTPLNAIIGMNNIALGSDDFKKAHQCHKKIDSASKHLLGIINDILDMSKIEADKFELSLSKFNFEKALMNIINVTNFHAEEKHQNLVINLNKNVPSYIFGDELRLSQVITNLLSNAIKFTAKHGSILLNVEKTYEADSDVTLLISVVDNGIGISEEQINRLFTSFEQADGSISRKFGGTGLGLAISKRIVELMNGTIWVESEPDKGSKFAFTIKVKKCEENTQDDIPDGLSPKIKKADVRILAVDDSEETLICFSNVMDSHELLYDVAASGDEALELIENCGDKPYNIFFIDWQMPEMDGIELTKRIKKITGNSSVVFMISVADRSVIEKEAVAAGVKKFIPKPLFPSSIIDAINESLVKYSKKSDTTDYMTETNAIPDFSKHTILIAEDIEINKEIMLAVLEKTGISIDFADNGKAAVSAFIEKHDVYSLILMDIQMPEMGGYEATRLIRSLDISRAKDIPIIAMTANVFKEDVENCILAGMNNHIGKPVDSNDLFEKLRKYLT